MSHATHTRDRVTGTATQCNSDCNTHCNAYCNTPGMGVPALVRQMVCQKTLISMTATLQHTATHCNTLQLTATHCNTLQHTATHCNTLPRTLLHTLQRILQHTRSRGAGAREAGDAPDYVAVCCSVCGSVLQRVAVCCSLSNVMRQTMHI